MLTALKVASNWLADRTADYPNHPDDVVLPGSEWSSKKIQEIDIWNYYSGVKGKMLEELRGRNIFIGIVPKGYKAGQKPVYVRHPYGTKEGYIHISDGKSFEKYHSGRTVEYHVTLPKQTPYFIIDIDAPGPFDQTKRIVGEVADKLGKLNEVRNVDIRFTGKRGFHLLGNLKKSQDVDSARNFLHSWLKEQFGDRKDVVLGESPSGNKPALGLSPMKINGGQVALWSLRVSGLCCIEVPRAQLSSFQREDASIEKVYKKATGRVFSFGKNASEMAKTVVANFIESSGLVTASYVREKLKPGYTGRFVIHHHFAKKAHEHFDLRLEFPVENVAKALGEYGRRRKEGPEPRPSSKEGPGTVLRSWAIPKHRVPTKGSPVLAHETEDHARSYISFKGTIPEGLYGAGTVDIYDHGTFKLTDVEYDKKYSFEMHGNKVKGPFALIKTSGKNFLWVRASSKEASVIDYPRPTMPANIWDLKTNPIALLPDVRKDVLSTLTEALEEKGLMRPLRWITNIFISGSSTSNICREDGDLDIDLEYNPSVVKDLYSELSKLSDNDLHEHLKKVIYQRNNHSVAGTLHTFSYLLLEPGDSPISEGLYDVLNEKWLRGPVLIPTSFDPDIAFANQNGFAVDVCREIESLTGMILRTIRQLKRIDQYDQFNTITPEMSAKKQALMSVLKEACERLDGWHSWIWNLPEQAKDKINAHYPAFNYSPNWEEKNIVFKYIARFGYHLPIAKLYKELKGDPYLDVIDQFITD